MCTSSVKFLRRHSQNDVMPQSSGRPSLRRRRSMNEETMVRSSCSSTSQPIKSDTPNLRRRRSMKEETIMQSSCTSSYQPIKAPMAVVYPNDRSRANDQFLGDKNDVFFRSSTARAVIRIASIALLLLSLLCPGPLLLLSLFGPGPTGIKHLSDTVMNLTKQYHNNQEGGDENIRTKLETLQHRLDEAEIELSWEKQHVKDQREAQQQMFNKMSKELGKREEVIKKGRLESTLRTNRIKAELTEERKESAKLKERLDLALKELATARSALPAAPLPPPRSDERGVLGKSDAKSLRGVPASEYQPGDSIEIIEHEEGGKVALRPGIVEDINPDGTYDLVKLEQATAIKGFTREQFQTYHVYHEGVAALFEAGRDFYLPVTIVRFIRSSAVPGYEVHGRYEFTYDLDEKKEKEIHVGQAKAMHRVAGTDELIAEQAYESDRPAQ